MDIGSEKNNQRNAMINNTLKSYIQLATKLSKKSQLNDVQKEQVKKQWVNLNKTHFDEKATVSNRRSGLRSRWRRSSSLLLRSMKC